jgi:hypothetical protein
VLLFVLRVSGVLHNYFLLADSLDTWMQTADKQRLLMEVVLTE